MRLKLGLLGVAVVLAGCSATQSTTTAPFKPEGGGSSAPSSSSDPASNVSASSVVMPPFGSNAHMIMTSAVPSNASWAAAAIADKNFRLEFLYSEYTSGQNAGWENYVGSSFSSQVQSALAASDVTTESFTGTIRWFDLSVFKDPSATSDVDVAMCFDNAQTTNTQKGTGKALPDTGSADQHYERITDQLAQDSSGQWQVVGQYPAVYYPRAKECKP